MNAYLPELDASLPGTSDSSCPMHAAVGRTVGVSRDDTLVLPRHKRLVSRYATDAEGNMELCLDYGEKEISFDDPDLFGFAEGLMAHPRFLAGDAIGWGAGYDWGQIRELLDHLIGEGILRHAEDPEGADTGAERRCSSPLPPSVCDRPRDWFECEDITAELTGRTLELGYLELVVPIYRIAHLALDQEGRQVGEANVFPPALRLDIPTEWKICQHAGSRYQDDAPMNVTALKAMRRHWAQCMAVLPRFREAYFRRYPQAVKGWTVGDLQRLATLVLTLPTYLLLRSPQPLANGRLHPVLSNLFRVTDGVRMTLNAMMLVPVNEPTVAPDTPVTAEQIYAYAERNNLFLSDHGVCAGPSAMIEELLAVLVTGQMSGGDAVSLDADVASALDELEASFDYELLALQSYAIANMLGPLTLRCYERLRDILEDGPGAGTPTLERLREGIRSHVALYRSLSLFGTETLRLSRERVMADIFRQAAVGLGEADTTPSLAAWIEPRPSDARPDLARRLYGLLLERLGSSGDEAGRVGELTDVLMDFFYREQALVRAGCRIQARINTLLNREQPRRPFRADDIYLYFRLAGDGDRRLPHPGDEVFPDILGLDIAVTPDGIDITALPDGD